MSVQHNLEKNLALFSYQKEDESFFGWLDRIAHLNCLTRQQFSNLITHDKVRDKIRFCDNEKSEESQNWTARSLISDYHYSFFSGRFCPKCFDDLKEPYYKQEWDYPWLTHCTKHGVPLISRCKQCNIQSMESVASWKVPWMACDSCIELNYSENDANKHIKLISPIVLKVIVLLKETPIKHKNVIILSTLLAIAKCVSEDFTHYSFYNYSFLRSQGIEPLDYLTSKTIIFDRYSQPIDGLSFDQSLACAWGIVYKNTHIVAEIAKHRIEYGIGITNILNQNLGRAHFSQVLK